MLRKLILDGVGPAKHMEAEFAPRLNLVTGDNGLGKSFLLDVAWWTLTRTWAGHPARPREDAAEASITSVVIGKDGGEKERTVPFDFTEQLWSQPQGRPVMPGLVLYAQVDGGFSVWDPARNYWKEESKQRPAAFLFSAGEVWTGFQDEDEKWVCNGLIRDWASWQRENNQPFQQLRKALETLSPPNEVLKPGRLQRIHPSDSQDYPTIVMPYGLEVPVVHASAAIRRVLALSYLLIWAWQEHLLAAELRREPPTSRIVFLIDEVEAHLHPNWQKRILPSLFQVIEGIPVSQDAPKVQVVASTHAPLVCVSIESFFRPETDRMFDLEFDRDQGVQLESVEFVRRGRAENWLLSPLFGLRSGYSEQAEAAQAEAARLMEDDKADFQQFQSIDAKLRSVLPDVDPFWVRWRAVGEKRGFLR